MKKILITTFVNGKQRNFLPLSPILVSDVDKLNINKDTLLILKTMLAHSFDFEISVRMDNCVNKIVVKPYNE